MPWLEIIRAAAAVTTVVAAVMVALNASAAITAYGFIVFVVASILWIAAGWLDETASLVIQNAVLLVVNLVGVWRWLPRAARESDAD